MTIPFHGQARSALLEWTEKTIKYAVSIMPASKVYLGTTRLWPRLGDKS
jgi:hypothetical protein